MRALSWDNSEAGERLRRKLQRLLEWDVPAEVVLAPARGWTPPADLRLCGKTVVLEMELPGLEREAVEVRVEGSTLTVAGERPAASSAPGGRLHQAETLRGPFSRSFRLPWELDAERAEAALRQGVLTVRIPVRGEGS